jgi:hypothetical protein
MWALLPTCCLVAMASFSTSASHLSRCFHTPNTGARNAIARGEELFNYTNIDIIDVAG